VHSASSGRIVTIVTAIARRKRTWVRRFSDDVGATVRLLRTSGHQNSDSLISRLCSRSRPLDQIEQRQNQKHSNNNHTAMMAHITIGKSS